MHRNVIIPSHKTFFNFILQYSYINYIRVLVVWFKQLNPHKLGHGTSYIDLFIAHTHKLGHGTSYIDLFIAHTHKLGHGTSYIDLFIAHTYKLGHGTSYIDLFIALTP